MRWQERCWVIVNVLYTSAKIGFFENDIQCAVAVLVGNFCIIYLNTKSNHRFINRSLMSAPSRRLPAFLISPLSARPSFRRTLYTTSSSLQKKMSSTSPSTSPSPGKVAGAAISARAAIPPTQEHVDPKKGPRSTAPTSGLTCSGCGFFCEAEATPLFRCPNADTLPHIDHVLLPDATQAVHPEDSEEVLHAMFAPNITSEGGVAESGLTKTADVQTNPFLRFKSLLFSWQLAQRLGVSADEYEEIVLDLTRGVKDADPTSSGFEVFSPLRFDEKLRCFFKDESGSVAQSHKVYEAVAQSHDSMCAVTVVDSCEQLQFSGVRATSVGDGFITVLKPSPTEVAHRGRQRTMRCPVSVSVSPRESNSVAVLFTEQDE